MLAEPAALGLAKMREDPRSIVGLNKSLKEEAYEIFVWEPTLIY